MRDETDAQLLLRSRRDPVAFEMLVVRHHARIHRYAARRVGPIVADDIVNEVFTAAFLAADKYDASRADARPWLFGITTNMIRRHARREAKLLAAYARTGHHPASEGSGDGDLGPALAAALARLKKSHRDALLLHALAELSYEEIAEALGVPIGTVRSWIHRARQTAARELAARGFVHATSPTPETTTAES